MTRVVGSDFRESIPSSSVEGVRPTAGGIRASRITTLEAWSYRVLEKVRAAAQRGRKNAPPDPGQNNRDPSTLQDV